MITAMERTRGEEIKWNFEIADHQLERTSAQYIGRMIFTALWKIKSKKKNDIHKGCIPDRVGAPQALVRKYIALVVINYGYWDKNSSIHLLYRPDALRGR